MTLKPRDFETTTPEDVARVLRENSKTVPVMLIFAPAELKYGALLPYIQRVMETHPTLYVYLPPEKPAPPVAAPPPAAGTK